MTSNTELKEWIQNKINVAGLLIINLVLLAVWMHPLTTWTITFIDDYDWLCYMVINVLPVLFLIISFLSLLLQGLFEIDGSDEE
jgi:hypothetical protein